MADTVSEAQVRYREAIDATQGQRSQIEEDLRFSDPANPQQWDEREKRQRESDPGGSRPCLVLDQVGQYVSNVAGQVEQRPPSLHAIPVDGGADKRVAEQLDGIFRHVEHTSRAQQHYARALTSAARAGVGYLIVRPEFVDRPLKYQEPRISSEGDPLRVILDPWSVEVDGSDADWGQLLTPCSYRAFEREFGSKVAKVSFGDESGRQVDDERESVVVCEEWRVETKTQNVIVCVDSEGDQTSLPEADFHQQRQTRDLRFLYNYKDKVRVVKWVQMSGADVLTKEVVYPASSIGLVPVYGYVGWDNGRMTYCGISRRARAAQRAYNFHASEIRALMATAPKSPWLVDKRAIRGLEPLWDRASVETRAYLPYNGVDENGQPIPPPARQPVAINLQNHIEAAQQALRDVQSSIGMYQANLGAPSNETSGVAINNRKEQGEASTAHFPSHLAAALGQVGKIVMEMVPRLIDTKRQLRIIGIDQTPSQVRIDPEQGPALVEDEEQGLTINPLRGRYDVRVVVGASFSTQRQQAQEAYTEMMRANPEMMPSIAPLWAQTLDVPYADKLAQVLTAMAPEPVKAILQPNNKDSTAALKAENEQLKKGLKEAIDHAHAAQQEADEAGAKADDKSRENEIREYEAETNRLKVTGANDEQIKAIVSDLMNQMLAGPSDDDQQIQPQTHEMQQFPGGEAMPEQSNALQQVLQGQEHLSEMLAHLAEIVAKRRVRVPVRDKAGNIVRVVDELET